MPSRPDLGFTGPRSPATPLEGELKRAFVSRHFDAAFVSGASAASYVESLGMPAHRIWRGYDVVDNAHFAEGARLSRRKELQGGEGGAAGVATREYRPARF